MASDAPETRYASSAGAREGRLKSAARVSVVESSNATGARMLRLSVLLPLLHAACAAVRPLPETVRIAITASAAVSRNDHVLDVASPGLVLGQACAGDDPCWVVQKKPAEPELCGDDGRSLASRNSLLLLSHYGGSVSHANYPNLMSVSVLAAMHMVDPSSFFFACPAAGGKLQAQTETLVFASTGGVLELAGNVGGGHHSYGCNVKELVLVLRRSGLQLALGGVPQAMSKQSFGDPVTQPDDSVVWPEVRRSVHEQLRAMLDALEPPNAALVASFTARMKDGDDGDDADDDGGGGSDDAAERDDDDGGGDGNFLTRAFSFVTTKVGMPMHPPPSPAPL